MENKETIIYLHIYENGVLTKEQAVERVMELLGDEVPFGVESVEVQDYNNGE